MEMRVHGCQVIDQPGPQRQQRIDDRHSPVADQFVDADTKDQEENHVAAEVKEKWQRQSRIVQKGGSEKLIPVKLNRVGRRRGCQGNRVERLLKAFLTSR